MPIIEGDLILDRDTIFDENLTVKGNILGKDGKRYNLKVRGHVYAMRVYTQDINVWNINAQEMDVRDIDARDIDVPKIRARHISVVIVTCETLIQEPGSKLIAKHVITNRNNKLEKKEEITDLRNNSSVKERDRSKT